MICAEVFGKTLNHPGDSALLQTRFGALGLLTFPKTKITLGRDEISDCQWDSGKYDGEADADWENYVRCQGAYFEGDWGVIVLCTMFLVSCVFFKKCLYLSYYMAWYLLDRHHTPTFLFLATSSYRIRITSWACLFCLSFCLCNSIPGVTRFLPCNACVQPPRQF